MADETNNTQDKALQVVDKEQRALAALVDNVLATSPHLKDRLTVPAVAAMMGLPDASFGWSGNGALSWAMKALAVITTLRYGLVPGMGHIRFLGNQLYLETSGARHMALTSPDFRFLGPRKIRALNDVEKEMLDWQEGDRALALEDRILVRGHEIAVTGYAIVERKQLEFRNNGHSLPGLANKKDIYQTLVTRCERDILKHYLPSEAPIRDRDDPETEEMRNVTPAETLAEDRPNVIAEMNRAAEPKIRDAERAKALTALDKAIELVGGRGRADAILAGELGLIQGSPDPEVIHNAVDVLLDHRPEQPPPTKGRKARAKTSDAPSQPEGGAVTPMPSADPGAVSPSAPESPAPPPAPPAPDAPPRAGEKAYLMIDGLLADQGLSPKLRASLEHLKTLDLREGDDVHLAQAVRFVTSGNYWAELEMLIRSRTPGANGKNGNGGGGK